VQLNVSDVITPETREKTAEWHHRTISTVFDDNRFDSQRYKATSGGNS